MTKSASAGRAGCFACWLLLAGLAGGTSLWAQEKAPAGATPAPAASVTIYTKDNAPPTPRLSDLPQKESVSRDGITWTFEKPAPAGQFVNGDWYVVGPVTIVTIDPAPTAEPNLRNGSVLNHPAKLHTSGFDNRLPHPNWFTKGLTAKLPIAMKPGDALVSSISENEVRKGGYPVKSYSVLTCLKDPVPADAFRPGYCDREQVIHLARDLRRELLPSLPVPAADANAVADSRSRKFLPDTEALANRFARPWHELSFLEEAQAAYQDGYGRGICQIGAQVSLSLMLDYKPQQKERLLQNYLQYGLDLWGIAKSDEFPGWPTLGGWGSGRKWPIVFAGLLFGDEKMAAPTKTYPRLVFQEDNQTLYDDCFTGAGVVYGGHAGWRTADRRSYGWGPYENLHPTRWTGWIGTSYRTNMTSSTWVGEALAIRILRAEKEWNYDPFLDYCDRWMYEPDPGYRNPSRFSTQGFAWDPFAEAMWKAYREKLPAIPGRDTAQRPTDGWQKKRELKGPAVEVGKNRELLVKGKALFPILLWAEHPGRIDDALAIGANVLAEGCFEKPDNVGAYWKLNIRNDKFLDDLAAKGLYGLFGADARTIGHPALLGWIHVDGPDVIAEKAATMTDKQLQEFSQAYRVMKAAQKVGAPEELKDMPDRLLLVEPAYLWMKKTDKTRPAFLTVGETFLKAAAEGKKDVCEGYVKNCDAIGCKVPLAQVGEAVAKLRELAGPTKPVYAWIETKGAKPEEILPAVLAAIKNGATAIGYRGFEGLDVKVKPDAAVMAALKKINDQITAHADELLADPSKAESLVK